MVENYRNPERMVDSWLRTEETVSQSDGLRKTCNKINYTLNEDHLYCGSHHIEMETKYIIF